MKSQPVHGQSYELAVHMAVFSRVLLLMCSKDFFPLVAVKTRHWLFHAFSSSSLLHIHLCEAKHGAEGQPKCKQVTVITRKLRLHWAYVKEGAVGISNIL